MPPKSINALTTKASKWRLPVVPTLANPALNTLTHASPARTSKTPGRTQLLNFFKLDDDRRLVDLPGYGYAKVPIPLKQHWQRHLEAYLGGRESLKGLILMMDIRHPMTDFDLLMLDWAVAAGMPMHILLTKADKLTYGAAKNTLLKVQSEIRKGWGDSITIQLFSAPKRMGPKRPTLYWPTGWNWQTKAPRRQPSKTISKLTVVLSGRRKHR